MERKISWRLSELRGKESRVHGSVLERNIMGEARISSHKSYAILTKSRFFRLCIFVPRQYWSDFDVVDPEAIAIAVR